MPAYGLLINRLYYVTSSIWFITNRLYLPIQHVHCVQCAGKTYINRYIFGTNVSYT